MLYLRHFFYYSYPYIPIYFSYYPCQFEIQGSEVLYLKGFRVFLYFTKSKVVKKTVKSCKTHFFR